MSDKVIIPIDAKVFFQMYEYAHYAHKHYRSEIAGWAHYNQKYGIYKLAPLLKQEALPADVETFPNSILNNTTYDISDMIVQWHSHVFMACNPSGTDNNLIKDALDLMPMIISIIVNCKNEYTATVTLKKAGIFTFDKQMKFDVELQPYYNNAEVSKDVKKKLTPPKPKIISMTQNYEKRIYGTSDNKWGYWDEEDVFHSHVPKTIVTEKLYNNDVIASKMRDIYNDNSEKFDLYDYGDSIWLFYYPNNDNQPSDTIQLRQGSLKMNGVDTGWGTILQKINMFNEKYFLGKYKADKNNSKNLS